MKKSIGRVAAVSAAALAALTAIGMGGASHANATPTCSAFSDPSEKTINGWGSKTMQDVYGAFTHGYMFDGHSYTVDPFGATVGAWNSMNPSTCQFYDNVTPVKGDDTFQRPADSVDGWGALSAANNPGDDTWVSAGTGVVNTLESPEKTQEVTFARASSLPAQSTWTQATGANDLTFIPQAIDAVGVAEKVNGSATEASNFNTGALTAVYTGGTYTQNQGTHTVGDIIEAGGYPFVVTGVSRTGVITADEQVVPVLPVSYSSTRASFLGAINATTFSASIVANETDSVAQEENNGTEDLSATDVNAALALNSPPYTVPANSIEIVPFAASALIEQQHGFVVNTTAGLYFPTINGYTLWNGVVGDGAGIGALQTAQPPEVTYGQSVAGDFAFYAWAELPSAIVAAGSALLTWLDSTLPGQGQVWTDFGFDPVGAAFSSNSSNRITTDWLN